MGLKWRSEAHLLDHFRDHGAEVGARTVAEYDASATDTIRVGAMLGYRDRISDEWHVGYDDRTTGRLAATNEDDELLTHVACDERYVRSLWVSSYR